MSLPSTGPISIGDVNEEVGNPRQQANSSLGVLHDDAFGGTPPRPMSDFHGYSAISPEITSASASDLGIGCTARVEFGVNEDTESVNIRTQINFGGWTQRSVVNVAPNTSGHVFDEDASGHGDDPFVQFELTPHSENNAEGEVGSPTIVGVDLSCGGFG